MTKKSILWIILDLIFLVVFNTVFFVIGGLEHPTSVWISYGFIHFSYLMVLITPVLTGKSSSAAVFGFSLYSISSGYFLIEFVVGLVFIVLRSESLKVALVVQIIVAAIYGVLLLSHLIANENTASSVKKREDEVAYMKTAAARVKGLMGKVKDKKARKEIERAYDMLHSSPTKTSPTVRYLESEITEQIGALEDAVQSENIDKIIKAANGIVSNAEERNAKLRLSH